MIMFLKGEKKKNHFLLYLDFTNEIEFQLETMSETTIAKTNPTTYY